MTMAKLTMTIKYTSVVGHYDGHGGPPVQHKELPNAACPGLYWKPLDAAIGQLLAPYCPGGRQGNRQTNKDEPIHLHCWLFQWPWQCAGTLPHASPDGGGLGLH
jgi:hypothetical protein